MVRTLYGGRQRRKEGKRKDSFHVIEKENKKRKQKLFSLLREAKGKKRIGEKI